MDIISNLLKFLLHITGLLLNPIISIPVTIIVIKGIKYKKSSYFKVTKLPYIMMNNDAGRKLEYLTYKTLKPFERQGAKFLFNVNMPKEDRTTTEIDVLMICQKGLFVFECKNYSGWIFGSEEQKYWYQTLPVGRGKSHKEKFYNPIMQNEGHIKALTSFIKEKIGTKSVIVFSDKCTLKDVVANGSLCAITHLSNVRALMNYYYSNIEDILDSEQIEKLYDLLYFYTQVDIDVRHDKFVDLHNQYSGSVLTNTDCDHKDESEEQMKCPVCGGILVKRIAKRGSNVGNQFLGCSNYPKCKYISNITKSN